MDSEGFSQKTGSAGPATPTNSRKERGAIAAQACENCRSRKQRCSEERPKCASCQRLGINCVYREPQPTKKDKTLVEIRDRIESIEGGLKDLHGKVNNLSVRGTLLPSIYKSIQQGSSSLSQPSRSTSWTAPSVNLPGQSINNAQSIDVYYRYVSATHKMLVWPFMQQFFSQQEIPELNYASLEKEGSGAMIGLTGTENGSTDNMSSTMDSDQIDEIDKSPLSMDWETMQRLSRAFFDTFNLLSPIMDRQVFYSESLPSLANNGFSESSTSTLACLVFALGEVALAAVQGSPVSSWEGRTSGVKGGSVEKPPGLSLFNEARKRIGFVLPECSVENIQIFALAALYHESNCDHIEFWRMSQSASLACQALLSSKPEELAGPQGDLVRRAFWHCSIMETCLSLELNMPLTGLDKYEDMVGLPDFSGSVSEEDYVGNQASHFQEHFASQIVLRRLSMEFNTTLNNALGNMQISPAASNAANAMTQLVSQLDQWRGLLPVYLRWQDEQPGGFSSSNRSDFDNPSPSMYSPLGADMHTNYMFTANLDVPPVHYPYAADVQTAILRSRYYHTRYILHRPFLYKALHYPNRLTGDDAEGVVECLKSILKWPITMSPTSRHKRLIPCLFFWSQNLLGILLILHLSQQAPVLAHIRTTMMDAKFEESAAQTVELCIDWIRDLKEIDSAGRWCWGIVRSIYNLGEDVDYVG